MSGEPLVCRGCGSAMTRDELDAGGWVNCCPERAMNEVIEQRHGIPALKARILNIEEEAVDGIR